jgi:hypothetical protein
VELARRSPYCEPAEPTNQPSFAPMSEGTRLELGGREAERRSGQQGITGADTDQLGTELLALLEEYGREPMKPTPSC